MGTGRALGASSGVRWMVMVVVGGEARVEVDGWLAGGVRTDNETLHKVR